MSTDTKEVEPAGDGASEQLGRIEKELNEAGVPAEVWISTDSTADRVAWLIIRNKLNQQNSRRRLKTIEMLTEALRIAAPQVCSMLCPSTKRTGTEWTHVEQCKTVSAALALVDGPQRNVNDEQA